VGRQIFCGLKSRSGDFPSKRFRQWGRGSQLPVTGVSRGELRRRDEISITGWRAEYVTRSVLGSNPSVLPDRWRAVLAAVQNSSSHREGLLAPQQARSWSCEYNRPAGEMNSTWSVWWWWLGGVTPPRSPSAPRSGAPRFDSGGPDRGPGDVHAPGENETHRAGLLRPGRAPGDLPAEEILPRGPPPAARRQREGNAQTRMAIASKRYPVTW
jgi:hypothetical protein